MRPVEKLAPGDTISFADKPAYVIQADYKPYASSKEPLIENIGAFCSYCAKAYNHAPRDLHVEHIQPQGITNTDGSLKYEHLKTKWFTIFAGEDAVRKRLIEDFPGTCASCFDATNHYEPIPRNPGKTDPT